MSVIDAKGMDFAELNRLVREAVARGERHLVLENVNGQRYIGCGMKAQVKLEVKGVGGADMAAFMDGPEVIVYGNAEHALGNTMNSGKVVVHGSAGDAIGYAMRGGRIFIRGDAGYRVGIHMKSYQDRLPVIVVGGTAQDFLGEYMAGGVLVVLGLEGDGARPLVGRYVGTGMHGGAIYLRGQVEEHQLGKEVSVQALAREDQRLLGGILRDYCADLGLPLKDVASAPFLKLASQSHRPYGQHYVY